MTRFRAFPLPCLGLLALACLIPSPAAAATISDLTVFSTNAEGNNWNSLIWNTQGRDPATGLPDAPNRFNLYVSTSPDLANPVFINSGNDPATASVSIDLLPGTYFFTLFGESAFTPLPADQHFVTNIYFNGSQASPGISGLTGPSCPGVCAAGHPNGLDIFGTAGHPEAGTLSWTDGALEVVLAEFTWITDQRGIDEVWPHWANHFPYDDGSGTPDFFGTMRLEVTAAPEPGLAVLVLFGAAGAVLRRRTHV